ncbi:Hypothetical_protein [Hexamita inflata]|uniref:Hypothetical_protein n=1 Tax=Hexamita inflata TaxID=28002 RepID=A0ABP1L0V4_9EUKA
MQEQEKDSISLPDLKAFIDRSNTIKDPIYAELPKIVATNKNQSNQCMRELFLSKQIQHQDEILYYSQRVKQVALQDLDLNSTNMDLQNLLLALKIEMQYGTRDKGTINRFFEAIKLKNPIENIQNLQNSPEVPKAHWSMQQFLQNFQKCVSLRVFRRLSRLFDKSQDKNNQPFVDFENILDYKIEDIKDKMPYIDFYLDQQFLCKFLQHYKQSCALIQINIGSHYKNIVTLTMQQKLNELLKIGFEPNQDEIDNLIANESNLTNIPTDLMSEFNASCELYTYMYNTVLFQNQFGLMSNYVGWQTHWKTIIQFVQTHINGESFQVRDLLCVVGGPKSGKTLTMYLSAIFMMNFVNLIRPQQKDNELFSQNITRIVQIDCIQYSAYDFIDKLKRIYVDIATQMLPSIKYSV